MSSKIRKMIRGKRLRRGAVNSRGKRPGGAAKMRHVQGPGLQFLTKHHDLKKADPECRICHGAGTKPSRYVENGKAKLLVCPCVPVKPKVEAVGS